MGQYHRIINLDKHEVIYSFDFGNGQKLMEWSYCKNVMCIAMLNLMAGEWKGDRVYVVGDYAEDDSDECWSETYRDTLAEFHDGPYRASDNFIHLIPDERSLIEFREDFDGTREVSVTDSGYRYIYNHNTKEYIDLAHCPLEWVWFAPDGGTDVSRIFPLSLLLDMGNGRGGGDYRADNADLCGSWCKDVQAIEVTKEKLDNGYEEFCPNFTERELVPWTDEKRFVEEERKRLRKQRSRY